MVTNIITILLTTMMFLPVSLQDTKKQTTRKMMVDAGIYDNRDIQQLAIKVKEHFRYPMFERILNLYGKDPAHDDHIKILGHSFYTVEKIFATLNLTVSDEGRALTPKEIADHCLKNNTQLNINLDAASLFLAVLEREARLKWNPNNNDIAWITTMAVVGKDNYIWVGIETDYHLKLEANSNWQREGKRGFIYYAFRDNLPKARIKFNAEPIPLDLMQMQQKKMKTVLKRHRIDDKCLLGLFNQLYKSAVK